MKLSFPGNPAMKELLQKYPDGNKILSLTDRDLDTELLEIIAARAASNGLTSSKFLSQGELTNIYGVTLSLAADQLYQINELLMASLQRLLSGNFVMAAPEQSIGVFTVTPKGRLGLPAEVPAEKPLVEWAGGARVTLAIVFTDIVGSTALGVELGDAAMGALRRKHFARSTELVATQAGREIKTIGDSVMSVFRSVEVALAYVRAFQLDPGAPELQVRAGIHIGSVEVTDDDVFGTEVVVASRVVGSIVDAEIWLSDRAKEDVDRAGTYRGGGYQWQPHDVKLKGLGAARLWSLAIEPDRAPGRSEEEAGSTETVPSAEEQRAEVTRRYFAPELARVIRKQIYILGRATANFITESSGHASPGDHWTSLKPAQPALYPHAPEFANLPAADATLLTEFYSLVQEIADTIDGLIENEPPPPVVNAWNVLMQRVRHSLVAGKAAVERFCPDRQFDGTIPTAGTLTHQIDTAIAPVQRALDAHLARHAATSSSAAAAAKTDRPQLSQGNREIPLREPNAWMAR